MKEILVTGGAGFIGSHIVQKLLRKGFNVVVIDNLNDYYSSSIKENNIKICKKISDENNSLYKFVECDIRDVNRINNIFNQHDLDVVFHEAAQAGVRYSVEDPIEPNQVNVDGTLNLLKASIDNDVNRFINASSSSVYGETEYLPFDEKHPKKPKSPYGVSKLASEHYSRVFNELYGLKTVSLRYFTVYGPRMRPGMAISNFVNRCLSDKPPVIFGSGKKTRDFTYIDDIIEANLKLLSNSEAFGEILNIGSGENISIEELAEKIIEITGFEGQPKYRRPKKGDVENTYADISKAKKIINYKPKVSLQEGLSNYVDWVKKNKNWY